MHGVEVAELQNLYATENQPRYLHIHILPELWGLTRNIMNE